MGTVMATLQKLSRTERHVNEVSRDPSCAHWGPQPRRMNGGDRIRRIMVSSDPNGKKGAGKVQGRGSEEEEGCLSSGRAGHQAHQA